MAAQYWQARVARKAGTRAASQMQVAVAWASQFLSPSLRATRVGVSGVGGRGGYVLWGTFHNPFFNLPPRRTQDARERQGMGTEMHTPVMVYPTTGENFLTTNKERWRDGREMAAT